MPKKKHNYDELKDNILRYLYEHRFTQGATNRTQTQIINHFDIGKPAFLRVVWELKGMGYIEEIPIGTARVWAIKYKGKKHLWDKHGKKKLNKGKIGVGVG